MGREHMFCDAILAEATGKGTQPVAQSPGRVRSCQISAHRGYGSHASANDFSTLVLFIDI